MMRIKTVLHGLSALIALLGYLALAPHLDPLPLLAFPLLLALALLGEARGLRLLPNWAVNAAGVAAFALYVPQLSPTHLVPAVNILALLLGLRLLGDQSPRQLLQLYVLALFALAGSTLFDLSPRFALYLFTQFLAVALALVLLCFVRSAPDLRLSRAQWRQLLGSAWLLPGLALPLAAALFLVLPRTQVPLWNVLNQQGQATAGYTERVQPGAAPAIATGTALVLRAEMQALAPEDLYWRGTVLNQFDGSAWERRPPPGRAVETPAAGNQVTQRIFPEPTSQPVVFALDTPLSIHGLAAESSPDRVFSGRRRAHQRLSYEAVSTLGRVLVPQVRPPHDFYVQLPADLPPRLRDLAAEIYADAPSAEERLSRLRRYFAEGGFRYSTSDLPTGSDPLGRFLLEERAGHCEFFASAFAVLLRLGDIPARLVGGYYGGDYNEMGGYYLVRENRAHVWVEVLREGVGWERLDPSVYAVNYESALRGPPPGGWRRSLHMGLDTLEHFWSVTLLTFDLERQIQALRQTRGTLRDLSWDMERTRRWGATATLVLVVAGGLGLLWRRRRREDGDALLRAFLGQARRRLGRRRLPPHWGLYDIAAQLDDPAARRFVAVYAAALYGGQPLSQAQRRELQGLLRTMKKSPQRNSRR
ncbi:transglutaminaseTgpA domain-containing protein [Geoalkalibacter halelectricus]|uniref:transglutaminase family protein n=1 Tax=Geoalkalibacter halelectricus TaxID=2847045 RepID=UPI003D25A7E4